MRQILEARWERNGHNRLYLKVDKIIEDFFKKYSNGEETSRKWTGKRFFKGVTSEELQNYLSNHYNDYGGKVIKNGQFNVALLRTIGISSGQEFEILSDEIYTDVNMRNAIESLRAIVTDIYKRFIKPVQVKCVITYEDIV